MKHSHDLDCKDLLSQMNDYIDGDLDDALCSEIEAHIKTCQHCQIMVNTLKKTITLCREEGREVNLPADARQRLFEKLNLPEDDD